jgi:hypothetical protein
MEHIVTNITATFRETNGALSENRRDVAEGVSKIKTLSENRQVEQNVSAGEVNHR